MTPRESILADLCQLERDARRAELLAELADCRRLRRELIARGDADLLPRLDEAERKLREATKLWHQRGELW